MSIKRRTLLFRSIVMLFFCTQMEAGICSRFIYRFYSNEALVRRIEEVFDPDEANPPSVLQDQRDLLMVLRNRFHRMEPLDRTSVLWYVGAGSIDSAIDSLNSQMDLQQYLLRLRR